MKKGDLLSSSNPSAKEELPGLFTSIKKTMGSFGKQIA
jgi:hypothetical protein